MAFRPTKYAHVVKNLPKYLGDDPDRLALLNAVRDQIMAAPNEVSDANWNISARLLNTAAGLQVHVQQLLETAKGAAIGPKNSSTIARAYADARILLDAITEWKSSAQLLVDAYERLMTDKMEEEGVASLRLDSGAAVSTYVEPYGKVVDPVAFRAWCVANGYEQKLQLWPSTMNAIAKERTLAGEAPPDGVEVTAKTQVRLNKA